MFFDIYENHDKEFQEFVGRGLSYQTLQSIKPSKHTFAVTVTLTNGVPIETVSKMFGHKSLKITQHYAKIVDKKVSEDMKVLKS